MLDIHDAGHFALRNEAEIRHHFHLERLASIIDRQNGNTYAFLD
jgi:hypothetical protein